VRELLPNNSIPGAIWPALPQPGAALKLALQYQLEESEWWDERQLHSRQFRQLAVLVQHARRTVPFYRQTLSDVGNLDDPERLAEGWGSLPLLQRAQIQEAGDGLLSTEMPGQHGAVHETHSSGSTGRPVRAFGTAVTRMYVASISLRDHLWHRRDLLAKTAAIRPGLAPNLPQGERFPNWGNVTADLFRTGPMVTLGSGTAVARQAEWLRIERPAYLLTLPSNLGALADHFRARGERLEGLSELRTLGETVSDELREQCRATFGVPLTDMYSAQETGYLALQCPAHPDRYHVQSEVVLVEILREDGSPCEVGEVGRVVVSGLHNFAMPLLRYVIGDYAEVGESCPCGRGLPVIRRILGRQRNMIRLPDGSRHWPSLSVKDLEDAGLRFRQIQAVQHSLERIEVRISCPVPLGTQDEGRLVRIVQAGFGHPFRIDLRYYDEIPRSPSGKFEDFISLVP